MSSRNILILTGAGFGKDAGLPLEKEIMTSGLEICRKEKPWIIERTAKRWESVDPVHPFTDYSFEELLTRIIAEDQVGTRSEEERLKLLDLYLDVLDIFVQTLVVPLSGATPWAPLYESFFDLYKDRAHFFTLNYDHLVERYLVTRSIPWDYGSDFPDVHYNLTSKHFYKRGESADFAEVFHYFKLHGSFNWHYCWRCGHTRVSKSLYFGPSSESLSRSDLSSQFCTECMEQGGGQPVMQPLIIPPSAIKYYNRSVFLQLWFSFNQILQTVEKLIIIGCSLRDDDTLLWQALYNLSRKNPNLRKIVVVNPDKSVHEKTDKLTGMKSITYDNMERFLTLH